MSAALARSFLFVPGNRPERFTKACAAGADAVIVDLEDAVPPADKLAARAALVHWLSPAHRVLVRINSADSEWFRGDLALCRLPGVAGIVLPKAERAHDLAEVASAGATAILPLIESAQGVWNGIELARSPCVQRLVFGAIDFSFDLGLREGYEQLLYFRSQLVLMSRVAGIAAPVDGVTVALDDAEQVRDDSARACALGFGGKLCIHPKQVPVVNAAFAPSAAELEWAARVMAASSTGAAVAVDGKMVDRPVILIARQMLDQAARRAGT
ncbi:MAG: citrate lyase subunit beta/citryl-CoA lyase [Janthinobacterium sp.]|jgi:citrate lyase subunit beta/citryl-CoA lyase